jgi:glycosyltransferase involved in cell wall biosynthesis
VDALITQNEQRAKIYLEERGARVKPVIVHNYKRRSLVRRTDQLRQLLQLSAKTRIVLYEGMVTWGRWLENLIQSVVYLPNDTKLVLMGKIDNKNDWWEKNVNVLLRQPKISKKVVTAPWVAPNKIMSYVADADVGVIIYDDSCRNNYFCEPGKLSDYVLAGVPVVAPSFPTIGSIIERYEIGAVFNGSEPADIARAIQRVLSTTKENYQQALSVVRKDLVWETQLPNFLKAVRG